MWVVGPPQLIALQVVAHPISYVRGGWSLPTKLDGGRATPKGWLAEDLEREMGHENIFC
jgi:hypothetical protein